MNLLETAIAVILAITALSIWVIGFICWMSSSLMEFIQTQCGKAISPSVKKFAKVANGTILVGLIPAAGVLIMLWQHFGK
jgi:hypothetical protein